MLDTVINNIRNELKRQRLSQNKFAELMDYSTVHMSNMMRGEKKGSVDTFSFLEKAAEVLKIPVTRLLPIDESAANYIYLTDMEDRLSNIAFKRTWLEQFGNNDFFIATMPDESMLPTIKLGDVLLVAKTERITHDGIYIFYHCGGTAVRRVTVQLNGQMVVHADNNLIPPTNMYNNELQASLIGQVVWLGRNV